MMVDVRLQHLSAEFTHPSRGTVVAVRDVDLHVQSGELLTLLGPSGCGKTTVLRIIAGFQVPTSGRVFIDNQDVTAVPANRRDIGFVFQNYALFPHLTVQENVAYGLHVRHQSAAAIARSVEKVLQLVDLAGFGPRLPDELSGGQQQRVALARAVVIQPRVLLFDEPLSELARARLRVLYETNDGFEIARCDLRLRGPGEFLGARQWGLPMLRFADLERDASWLETVRQSADRLLHDDPPAAQAMIQRWYAGAAQYLGA